MSLSGCLYCFPLPQGTQGAWKCLPVPSPRMAIASGDPFWPPFSAIDFRPRFLIDFSLIWGPKMEPKWVVFGVFWCFCGLVPSPLFATFLVPFFINFWPSEPWFLRDLTMNLKVFRNSRRSFRASILGRFLVHLNSIFGKNRLKINKKRTSKKHIFFYRFFQR